MHGVSLSAENSAVGSEKSKKRVWKAFCNLSSHKRVDDELQQMAPRTDIRDRARKCIDLFRDCVSSQLLGRLKWIGTGHADFNLWAWGLNATSTGKSSLDSRLSQRADVLGVICDLLDGLAETLRDSLIQGKSSYRQLKQPGVNDSPCPSLKDWIDKLG